MENRKKILFGILRVSLALALAAFISQIKLDLIGSYLYDLEMRVRPAPPGNPALHLVLIDPLSVEKLKSSPGFAEHTAFLRRLAKENPLAVLYAVDPTQIKGTDKEREEFLKTASLFPQLSFLTEDLEMKGEEGRLRFPAPFETLNAVSGPISSDTSNFAKDGVTRRFLIFYQNRPMIHVEVARLLNSQIAKTEDVRGQFEFLGTTQAYINFRPPKSYPQLSFATEDLSPLKGKIIIVGRDTQLSEKDYALTPYSRESVGMTSAEVHANIIDTLLRNDSPVRAPAGTTWVLVTLISLLTVYVVFSVQPAKGLLILGATLAGYLLLVGLAFWPLGVWLPAAHPLLAIFLCYYFFIPYRLIIENRRSWEFYQKHQLLQQVEELKTNFISMMSHDLKTPIARILGMTDVIQRDPTALSGPQHEALDTIRASSEDLLKFINSILQYGKIEAQQLQLQTQAKDVNELLKEALTQYEFLAKIKRIELRTELETLFPISVDPHLLRQVFSNLIENAIKYSYEDTKILISTEEKEGFVCVQIADQGPGIPEDELPHVFMKFFRSKKAKSSVVKGSGLGLYLAKYFVELHGGRLSVESSYGQGSTFTVELPLNGGIANVKSSRS